MNRLTKRDALIMFRDSVAPGLLAIHGPGNADVMRDGWIELTNTLCEEGKITDSQAIVWSSSFRDEQST